MTRRRRYTRLSPKVLYNLRSILQMAYPRGSAWYREANSLCQQIFLDYKIIPTLSFENTIGIVAVLSPGQEWSRNIESTKTFLAAFAEGKRGPDLPATISVYGTRNIQKAEALAYGHAASAVLSGPKVTAFFECIINPTAADPVVIDRHARTAALGLQKTEENAIVKSTAEYRWLAAHYRRVASEFGLVPSEAQAIVWEYWRAQK